MQAKHLYAQHPPPQKKKPLKTALDIQKEKYSTMNLESSKQDTAVHTTQFMGIS